MTFLERLIGGKKRNEPDAIQPVLPGGHCAAELAFNLIGNSSRVPVEKGGARIGCRTCTGICEYDENGLIVPQECNNPIFPKKGVKLQI